MRKILGLVVASALLAGSAVAYGQQDPKVLMPAGGGEPIILPENVEPSQLGVPTLDVDMNSGEVKPTEMNPSDDKKASSDAQTGASPEAAKAEPASGQPVAGGEQTASADDADDQPVRNNAVPRLAPGQREYLSRSIEVFGAMPLPKKMPRPTQAMHEKDAYQVTKSIVSVGEPRFLNRSKAARNTVQVINGIEPSAPTPTSFTPLEGQGGNRPGGNPPVSSTQ